MRVEKGCVMCINAGDGGSGEGAGLLRRLVIFSFIRLQKSLRETAIPGDSVFFLFLKFQDS